MRQLESFWLKEISLSSTHLTHLSTYAVLYHSIRTRVPIKPGPVNIQNNIKNSPCTDSLIVSAVSVIVSSVVTWDACSKSQVLVWKSSGVRYVMISSSVLCFNSTIVMNALNTSLTVSGMVVSLVKTSATNDVYPSRSMRCTIADCAGAVLSAGNWPVVYTSITYGSMKYFVKRIY